MPGQTAGASHLQEVRGEKIPRTYFPLVTLALWIGLPFEIRLTLFVTALQKELKTRFPRGCFEVNEFINCWISDVLYI